jgi:hypothetical protein
MCAELVCGKTSLLTAQVGPFSSISPSQVALWKGASGSHLTAHVDLVRFERWLNPSSGPCTTCA